MVIGDIVRLKSGGPAMTVAEVRADGCVNVEWFVDEVLHRDAFDARSIVDNGWRPMLVARSRDDHPDYDWGKPTGQEAW